MKNYLVYLAFLSFILTNCQKKEIKTADNKMINQNKTQIEKNKQITYAIHINSLTPYELYLDDILVDYFYGDNKSKTVELNQYLLHNGLHKLKIKFLPAKNNIFSKNGLLSPKDINLNNDTRWRIYFIKLNKDQEKPLGYSNEIDYKNNELKINPPTEELPYWEQSWDLDIKELPYNLKGWSDSEDLSKMDREELKKEVVDFFEKQRTLLNEGKIDEYLALGKEKDKEIIMATYDSNISWYNSQERKDNILRAEGHMLPLENYELVLYGNGRLATLKIATGQYKNWSALMSKEEKGRVSGWGILLHKPKNVSRLEIIRK
ncbi:hypothetical protein [Chryseobacterium foetidum]|uniref:hypothetical protein n=1 Tax=Chryseobacterium foetidum TaxID=2951057 RepID=UPI0021C81DF6|nr:hypothetical protein [Chryseobacterium foetidum]